MITCSAPAKVYLFGEHAVVYNESAICCAVNIRTRVNIEYSENIVINSSLGTTGIDYEIHPYVSAVVEKIRKKSPYRGVSISIESDIPVGSGLGSSAAVVVATICAFNNLLKLGMDKESIASFGHSIEKEIQGAASATDTYVSTMGGTVAIPARQHLKNPLCNLIIGNTNVFSSTGQLVAKVASLKSIYPEVITPILSTIGKASLRGESLLENENYRALGELMDVNQGLLEAIGVGCDELSRLIHSSRAAGAFGAKITGAGGGGCMLALADNENIDAISRAIKNAGGIPIVTGVTDSGVRVDFDNE
jgi:mevalonate kinase